MKLCIFHAPPRLFEVYVSERSPAGAIWLDRVILEVLVRKSPGNGLESEFRNSLENGLESEFRNSLENGLESEKAAAPKAIYRNFSKPRNFFARRLSSETALEMA